MKTPSPSRAGRKPRFDKKRRAVYLDALSETGVIGEAMNAAGVSSRATIKAARDGDPEFKQAENEALDAAADKVEALIATRSMYGHQVPIVDHEGRPVLDPETGEAKTVLVQPDNKMLMARAKAMRPERYATERRHHTGQKEATVVMMPVVEHEAEFEKMLENQKQRTDAILAESETKLGLQLERR
ncbi:MAG: hypothetical protein AAGK02_07010 [Pseudomonadota bacterium]